MEKPEIKYPCIWPYKIIGSDRKLITNSVTIMFKHKEFEFKKSNQSTTGKYISFELSVKVESDEERYKIFETLKNIPTVKIIL